MAMDIIARALALRGISVASSHEFSSNAERDSYFATNPSELIEGIYIRVGNTMQQRQGDSWIDVTPVIKGDAGATGSQGVAGNDGANATINGKEAINISAGDNITIVDTADGIQINSNYENIVTSVNTKVGAVVLNKDDIGLSNVDNTSDLNKPIATATQNALDILESLIPTKLSELTNDKNFISDGDYTHTDENFTTEEKNKLANIESGAQVNPDLSPYATIASTDIKLAKKQDTLISGNNIKTINGETLLGSGNIVISGGGGGGAVDSVNGQTGTVVLNKSDIGLANVDNTSDFNKPISNATQTALQSKADLIGGYIPPYQLPSFVDDVIEVPDFSRLPDVGEPSKIYITLDTNQTYRWGGSTYVILTSGVAIGETAETAYRGDRGKIAYEHTLNKSNPHNVNKVQIGLENVDNTSDLAKPISTAMQVALDAIEDLIPTVTSDLINNSNFVSDIDYVHTDENYTTVEKTKLAGLSNYNDAAIRNLIDDKADTTYVVTELDKKQDELTAQQLLNINNIGDKADTTYVDTQLNSKQNILTAQQITNINAVPSKADKSEIPTELPNPFTLTFTGESTATYDGTGDVTVHIPAGSSGTTNHAGLINLTFADSGHIGFQEELSASQLANIGQIPTIKATADSAIQTETDPTVPAWAKTPTKPTYTAEEVGALSDDTVLFSGDYNDLTNKPNFKNGHSQIVSSADLTDGKISITHNLNSEDLIVQVYDHTKEIVLSDYTKILTANSIDVSIQSFLPLGGDYKVVIMKITT